MTRSLRANASGHDRLAVEGSGELIRVEDLRTWFQRPDGVVRAVDGVSLTIFSGRTLGVVGESGSGKSVLARSIMGLLPRTGTERSGRVYFRREEVTGLPPAEMRRLWGREMAMVFQDPMTSLNPVMTIGAQLTEALRYHLRMSRQDARDRAVELLTLVGIPEPARRLRQYPHQLSGGMRQRITIAIALSCEPSILFADEPTTALDVTVQAQILDLLAAEQRRRNMAMVLITHDLGVAAGRTDEIVVMYAGRIVEQAPTPTLFSTMRMPYTEALFRSIPRLEHPPHTRLPVIPGSPPSTSRPPAGCPYAPRCAYAQPRCTEEAPPLEPSGAPGHRFACWFPVGTPRGEEALRRNVQAEQPNALATFSDSSRLGVC